MGSECVRGKLRCMKSCYRWDVSRSTFENCVLGEKILSPVIPVHINDFQLELYPRGTSKRSSNHVSIFLKLLGGYFRVKFHLSILDSDGRRHAALERTEMFGAKTRSAWGTTEFVLRDELMTGNGHRFFSRDELRIWCEISFGIAIYEMPRLDDEDDDDDDEQAAIATTRKRPRLSLEPTDRSNTATVNPFEKYFDNERSSDAKFVLADGRCIHAHAMILEIKSDVFAEMFARDVSVASPGIINVKDIDYEVLYEAIRFVYTDRVDDLDKYAEQLLEPANRFVLDDLKLMCERNLCENLTVANVIDSIILAEDYNLAKLKERAKLFVAENMKNVVHLTKFEDVMTDRPNIALEIVRCNAGKPCSHNPNVNKFDS